MITATESNAAALADRWRRRSLAIRPQANALMPLVRDLVVGEARRVMEERIYSVPVPRDKPGRAKWQRTRKLIALETGLIEGLTIRFTNGAEYTAARYWLGTPKGRPIRSPGIQSVQWRRVALDRTRGERARLCQEANIRILKAP